MTSIHNNLTDLILELIKNPDIIPDEICEGRTILIPKKGRDTVENYRPIACLSIIYKIIIKVLCKILQNDLSINNKISFNQLGLIPNTQAAKE